MGQRAGPGDFSGDGCTDVLAIDTAGALFQYRGNCQSGWVTGAGEQIGGGWYASEFKFVFRGGDFSGDGCTDVLAIDTAGALFQYRGNCSGGWGSENDVGSGWHVFNWIY